MPINSKKCRWFQHEVAYRTVPSTLFYGETYSQKFCVKCRHNLGLSERQFYKLNRIKHIIGIVFLAVIIASLVCAVLIAVSNALVKKDLIASQVACVEYGKALGYDTKLDVGAVCYIEINNAWVKQTSYETYLEVKAVVER